MPRIAGVDIPADKRTLISLTYIYGIGPFASKQILKATGIDESVRAKDLTEDECSRIGAEVERGYVVEGQLRRTISQNISRLKDISWSNAPWNSVTTSGSITGGLFLIVTSAWCSAPVLSTKSNANVKTSDIPRKSCVVGISR